MTPLNKKLISVELQKLYDQINKDNRLKWLLTTPIRDLPDRYYRIFDVESLTDESLNATLLDIIKQFESGPYKNCVKFISESSSGNYVGWGYYLLDPLKPIVRDIGIVSFNLEHPSIEMVKDFLDLIEELYSKYREIHFLVNTINPAVKTYRKALDKLDIKYVSEDIDGVTYFDIYSKKLFERRYTEIDNQTKYPGTIIEELPNGLYKVHLRFRD